MKRKYLIYTVFFASGISGLMYEVVWLRMLARITGVTLYATATVLAAYMSGLALGSFVLGRVADKRRDELRVYALLEMMVGVTALLVPAILPALIPVCQFVYGASGENALVTTTVQAVLAFLVLLIPTTMMGGTLPVLTACLAKRETRLGKNLSLLYGLNTLGAVIGVFLSGFVIIEWLGERSTIYLGVAINLVVSLTAYFLYRADRRTVVAAPAAQPAPQGASSTAVAAYSPAVRTTVLLAFAVSGFTALAYEVIWTRQLILYLETTVYAFSGMLIVFLCGIALGSMFLGGRAERLSRPLAFLALLEGIVGLASVAGLYLFRPLDAMIQWQPFPGAPIVLRALAAGILVFPTTFLFGAIFPVAAICYAREPKKTGSSVGLLYGANTVGCIFGSLATGFLLIPSLGSTRAMILLACINVALGAMLLVLERQRRAALNLAAVGLLAVFVAAVLGVSGQDPFLATIESRILGPQDGAKPALGASEIYFNKEGVEGTVTAFSRNGRKSLWINGIGMTWLCTETKLMAYLPLSYVKDPKDMLIICFGMGTTTRSAALYPDLNIVAVELVPETFRTFRFYHSDAERIKKMPNVHLLANDGRNALLLSKKQYDVISVDPAPPIRSAGTVNLYTTDFFRLCKSRLKPHGVMCMWFFGEASRVPDSLALLHTFSQVFPKTDVWKSPNNRGFYMIGMMQDVPQDEFEARVERLFAQPRVVRDLGEFDKTCVTPQQLEALRWLDPATVRSYAADGALVTDNEPFTEFFLGRRLREILFPKAAPPAGR